MKQFRDEAFAIAYRSRKGRMVVKVVHDCDKTVLFIGSGVQRNLKSSNAAMVISGRRLKAAVLSAANLIAPIMSVK